MLRVKAHYDFDLVCIGADPRGSMWRSRRKVEDVLARQQVVIEEQLRRNDVSMVQGEAPFADLHTLIVRGQDGCRQIAAGTIVIAVGTEPASLPGVAANAEIP